MSCKGCLAAILAVLAATAITGAMTVRSLGDFLDVTEPVGTVDAIVVMGGEGGRHLRTQHALELYESGAAPQIVFSGGTLLSSGLACSSTEMSVGAAEMLGLPSKAMVISGEAQSTLDEADNVAALAEENGWQSLALVTDRFHTRRSLQTMQSRMPDMPIVTSAPDDSRFNAEKWWSTEQGLVFVINELLKLGFYWKEYGIQPF